MIWTNDLAKKDPTCPDCHKEGPIQLVLKDGVPVRWCPFCGYFAEDHSWYQTISADKAREIIDTRQPKGLFLVTGDTKIVGIDNSTGDAWTEEFLCQLDCLRWLLSEDGDDYRTLIA